MQPTAKLPSQRVRTVKLPRHNLRRTAAALQRLHRVAPSPSTPSNTITVVCISDTHNSQPPLPPGDILLHAGDLSNWGTFSEIQAQLHWLSQQQHQHKIIIAGNHDLLFDVDFQKRHPGRWKEAQTTAAAGAGTDDHLKVAEQLDFGNVTYLQNSSVNLQFEGGREITIYGSPRTPQYGLSAFQYHPHTDIWSQKIPQQTDIILSHGPPWGHLDGPKKSGCLFLASEVVRVRPCIVVYGHIHIGHGTEERVFDHVGKTSERIEGQLTGWTSLPGMIWSVVLGRIVPIKWQKEQRRTTYVNAAVVEGWENHVVKHTAVVVQI